MGSAARPVGAVGVSALYAAYFAYVGLFSPYISLWLDRRGLSVGEIAFLLTLPQALRIVAPPFWGWLADHTGRRVCWLRLSAFGGLMMLGLLPLADRPLEYGLAILLLSALTAAQAPIGETLALNLVGGDPGRYGRMRLWGSVGFLLTVAAGGALLQWLGIQALPLLLVTAMAALVGVTLTLRDAPVTPRSALRATLGARLRQPQVIAFLVSAFFMVFAHSGLYTLFSLFLARQGFQPGVIGALWSVGVVAELLLFAGQRVLFARNDPRFLLVLCCVAAALRFAWIAGVQGSVWALVGAQCLHALSFALHHSASMALLHQWFEPAQQARAQSAFVVVSYGLGGVLGGWAAGWIWAHISPAAVFGGAAVAAALAALSALLCARTPHSVAAEAERHPGGSEA